MLKKYLLPGLCVFETLILFLIPKSLMLVHYIFYSIVLFPYFILHQETSKVIRRSYLIYTALLGIYLSIAHFSIEILFLLLIQFGLWLGFFLYQRDWERLLKVEIEQKDISEKDLQSMNRKLDSRLTSLHHLEKQVAGLLDLFEVAKDFTEYLSFTGVAEILLKRVKPLFPFNSLKLLLIQDQLEDPEKFSRFLVNQDGIALIETPIDEEEKDWLKKIKINKTLIQGSNFWVFPILYEENFRSLLYVESGQADDLAKFEVLSSFLTLQIAKIRLYNAVKELAIRDSLTQVFVRRHFLERFEEELRRSVKYSIPLAVLMLDIDLFKRYNDDYGHLAGDATLQQVASIICQSLRKVDIVGRYGGEEFSVVIPETSEEGAMEISERIRSNIARNVFKIYNTETRVTVSIGLVLFQPNESHKENVDYQQLAFELIQNADHSLYKAKDEGRNQVILYKHS